MGFKILYIANALPYDSINHAGGRTFNYYFKRLLNDNVAELTVIGICKEDELSKLDNEKYGYNCIPVVTKGSVFRNIYRVGLDLLGKIFKLENYGQSYYKTYKIIKESRRLKNFGYVPDIVFLEWTNCVLMVEGIKKIFPKAKIVASEYDVSFLAIERKINQSHGAKKEKLNKYYMWFKDQEVNALKRCDYSLPESNKDKQLLVDEGLTESNIGILVPYFHDMSFINRRQSNHDILFWGAMYRPDNYEAAIWFIDNVMPLLEGTDVRFIVAGNRPPEILKNRANDKVIVTGFVEDESPLFEKSLCFVSPLLTGAGIKVKIIEALSAGIPVLTNNIGIEGIPAQDGVSYFHCEKPVDYECVIRKLLNGDIDTDKVETTQKALIKKAFNLEQSYQDYLRLIKTLYNIGG